MQEIKFRGGGGLGALGVGEAEFLRNAPIFTKIICCYYVARGVSNPGLVCG